MKKFETYRFKIDAYTPDTLPMSRCAEYLMELATMLGETPNVHFMRLEAGSTVMVHKVDIDAVPKVRERVTALKRGDGTETQVRAYNRINRMLLDDHGTGVLIERRKMEVIRFPGKEEGLFKVTSVQQHGEIDGELIRIGGIKDIVPLTLESEGKEITKCQTKRTVARELAKHIFQPVRLFGEGRWDRDINGDWSLEHFFVDYFEPLEENALSQTILALRELKGDWNKNALHELLDLRHAEGDVN